MPLYPRKEVEVTPSQLATVRLLPTVRPSRHALASLPSSPPSLGQACCAPPGPLTSHLPMKAARVSLNSNGGLADLASLSNEKGECLLNQYTFHGQIGRGCATSVYIVRDVDGAKACKLARRRPNMRWSKLVKTFRHESLLLQRCVHPNIVEYHGLYLSSTEAALVLGLAPDGDCQQLLLRHGPRTETAAGSIMSQLCVALDFLHQVQRVLHRDVKLENVLVCEYDHSSGYQKIKLCDFGHSCLMDEPLLGSAVDDGFKGTEGYVAPEVASGGLWTPAADVWSAGVVFYALLANELLRWKAPDVPDIFSNTSRAFAKVSTKAKLLVKSMLLPESERSSFGHVISSLEQHDSKADGSPSKAGLRRRPMGSYSYSHMDLASMDKVSVREEHDEPDAESDSVASTPVVGSPSIDRRHPSVEATTPSSSSHSPLIKQQERAIDTPSSSSQPPSPPTRFGIPLPSELSTARAGVSFRFEESISLNTAPKSFFEQGSSQGGIPFHFEQSASQAGIPLPFEQPGLHPRIPTGVLASKAYSTD